MKNEKCGALQSLQFADIISDTELCLLTRMKGEKAGKGHLDENSLENVIQDLNIPPERFRQSALSAEWSSVLVAIKIT